ncbi:MAG: DUF4390 domain-containing protein [Proteobacteria bacterium]|jgi:hypothetical protein|nr:DUF4390 domain-containing protein [Pseudomonadota bacterium]MBK7116244.1 DUF4390 domain-containing protein [Pseudomonadota bacterium]MBK9252349.1 DUF4390 domain-containing protein [Pseudomonadota bacterium]MCC6633089.1 DUF4390 domain-containing protein [Gammaproteobacteria bacterium]
MRGSWGQRLALFAWLCLMAAAAPAQNIVVQSAFVNVQGGVFDLSARVIFPLNDDVRRALSDGATVSLELRAVVDRQRRYWFDAELIDASLERELSWNAVSQRYILREAGHTEQQSFTALDQALSAAGQVHSWPVLVDQQLDPESTYAIRVRASIRRGRLPDALRSLVFWSDGWNLGSEWYTWILPR